MRILPFLLVAFGAMAASGNALAHASLVQSTPADGSVLTAAPQSFVLTFSEPVSPIAMRLVDADGIGSDLGQVRAQDENVVIAAPPIRAGTHALSWRVISADGHPVGGSIVFSVGEANASGIVVQTGSPPLLMALIWGARFILYSGLFVGVGGRFFRVWIAAGQNPAPIVPKATVICLGAGLASTVVSIGLQGLDVLGVDLAQLRDWSTWHAGLTTSYVATLAVAAGALALALMSGWSGSLANERAITAVALLAVGAAVALSGHASTAPPQVVTRPAIFIHGACITFWVGSLIPLAALVRSGGPQLAPALARFSRAAPLPVALLVASGGLLAVVQLGRVSALWTTTYGMVFDAKIFAVFILLGLGAWNRFILTPRVGAGRAAAGRAMVRSIAVEMLLVAIILGLVATWRFTPPPRASVAVSAVVHPVRVHIRGERAMADLILTPGKVGPSSVAIAVLNGHFGQMEVKGITLVLSSPAAGVQPIRREARHIDGANWTIDVLTIPSSGKWIGKVDILISDFEEISLQGEFDMPR